MVLINQKHQEIESNTTLSESESFKFQARLTRSTRDDGDKKNVEIAVPSKQLSNFQKTLEMSWIIDCEINLILTCFENFVISSETGETKLSITDTKHYVPIVTLSAQDKSKVLEQSNMVFKEQLTGINIDQKSQ